MNMLKHLAKYPQCLKVNPNNIVEGPLVTNYGIFLRVSMHEAQNGLGEGGYYSLAELHGLYLIIAKLYLWMRKKVVYKS
jgi:hypothetical protein